MDSRAVSPLIGFILLMSIVMGLIGILQSTAVPQWNKAVEARHFGELKYEVADVSKVISISASTGSPAKVVLKAGVDYPNYYVLVSPSKASTTTSVKDLGVRILNSDGVALVDEKTSAIIFEPNYFYSSRSKLIYEHSAVLRLEDSVVLKESDQNSFSKSSISLYILKAKFNSFATTETANLILIPISVGGRNPFSGNIIFECFDEKTAEWWNSTLKEVYRDSDVRVSRNDNIVEVANLKNITLSINVFEVYAVVSGETSQAFGITPEKFTPLTDTQFSVYQYSTVMLGAKLVDRFGNPVKNYPVTISVSSSNGVCNSNPYQTATNERGEIWYYFNANVTPEQNKTIVTCTVSFTAGDGVEPQDFTVEVNASVPFCEECPANGECPPTYCPPTGGLSGVRSGTLTSFSCANVKSQSQWNYVICPSSPSKCSISWIDNDFVWYNLTSGAGHGNLCPGHFFNFTLPDNYNTTRDSLLIVWKGSCKYKQGTAYVDLYIIKNNLLSYINSSTEEIEANLKAGDYVSSDGRITVAVVCSKSDDALNCPPGQRPYNLSTDYIEILFIK